MMLIVVYFSFRVVANECCDEEHACVTVKSIEKYFTLAYLVNLSRGIRSVDCPL